MCRIFRRRNCSSAGPPPTSYGANSCGVRRGRSSSGTSELGDRSTPQEMMHEAHVPITATAPPMTASGTHMPPRLQRDRYVAPASDDVESACGVLRPSRAAAVTGFPGSRLAARSGTVIGHRTTGDGHRSQTSGTRVGALTVRQGGLSSRAVRLDGQLLPRA